MVARSIVIEDSLIKNKVSLKISHKYATISLALAITLGFGNLNEAFAERSIKETNYFTSLRTNETNFRAGPGVNYPIKFIFKLRSIPVRVIREYDNWSELEDYEGNSGWVNQNLLTKKRSLMVYTDKPFVNMYAKNSKKSNIIYRLENNVIGSYLKCVDSWCALKVEGEKGWVEKDDLWGD